MTRFHLQAEKLLVKATILKQKFSINEKKRKKLSLGIIPIKVCPRAVGEIKKADKEELQKLFELSCQRLAD